MVLVATQVKRRRGTTAENDAFTGAEGEITVDTEKHELRVHDGMTQGGFKIGGGSGRNIGDLFMTKRTDSGLAGAVDCDGATYNTTDFTGSGSIGELLEAGKLDYVSLSAYSTAISTNGWCDKIGWDGTGTTSFRVPTLTPRIVQTNNIPVIGNGSSIYVRSSGGTVGDTRIAGWKQPSSAGYKYLTTETSSQTAGGNNETVLLSTDPTKSGIIADTSNTAQLRVMIQLANGATDQALETCTGVLADVAGLKDMSNITATGKEVCANLAMPSSRYTDLTLGAHGAYYTAPADGYFSLYATSSTTTGVIGLRNDTTGMTSTAYINTTGGRYGVVMPVSKGQQVQAYHYNMSSNIVIRFVYANGAQ